MAARMCLLCVVVIVAFSRSSAVPVISVDSVGQWPEGQRNPCPDDTLVFTCIVDLNALSVRWTIGMFTAEITLSAANLNKPRNEAGFTAVLLAENRSTLTVNLREVNVGNMSDVVCEEIQRSTLLNDTFTINIIGSSSGVAITAAPTLKELNVQFDRPVYGWECVSSYSVVITSNDQIQGNINITVRDRSQSSFQVPEISSGVNLCRYSYNVSITPSSTGTIGEKAQRIIYGDPSILGQVRGNYSIVDERLIWTPPSNAPSQCVDQYGITIRDSSDDVIAEVNETSTSLLVCDYGGIPPCVPLTVTITPSVPRGGFVQNSASVDISVDCQPSGFSRLFQSFTARTECLNANAEVVLDTSVVCQADELSLMIKVDSSDGTRPPDQLNVVGSCRNAEASLYTCAARITANSYDTRYSMTAAVMARGVVVGTMALVDPAVSEGYCHCNISVCAGLPIALVIIIVILITVAVLIWRWVKWYLKCKNKPGHIDKEEACELKDQTDDSNIDHEKGPAGDEYAVVEKKPKNAVEVMSQSVYQDPNTIVHEQGPETGDLYAVTEKKPKKKAKKTDQNTDEEVAATYSVPDKTKKAHQQGITYADVVMAAPRGDDKPMHQPPQTEYATVVN